MMARILSVGLTGGIASGKTVVTGEFGRLGAIILDADGLAHKLMEPGGPGYAPVVERFGDRILAADGRVDRRALGRRVFADPRERWALNAILHPLVIAEEERLHQEIRLLGQDRVVVTDAALLIEAGTHRRFDRLVVVHCSPESQIARLRARDGVSREEAVRRLQAQMPVADKVALADYAIDTEGTEEQTRRKARELFPRLQADLERKLA